jgi:4-aminobutyrate aminotransferase-like enzyme
LGFFIAVDLESAEAVNFCVSHARENGLLIFYFLSTPTAFRIAPPLVISDAEITEALRILRQAFEAWTIQRALKS